MKIRPTTGTKRDNPIALKAGDDELEILEIAAKLCDMNLSLFIMNSALKHACDILEQDAEYKKMYKQVIEKIQKLIISEDV